MSKENIELIAGRVLDIINPVGEGGKRKYATWAFFSDFHNSDNVEGEPLINTYGGTAYYGLETLRSIKRIGQTYHYDFILSGGDISSGREQEIAANNGNDPVLGQMERIFGEINTMFPGTPFVSAVGNHDKKYGAQSSLKTGAELHNVIGAAFNNSGDSGVTISWATADAGETNIAVDVERHKLRLIVADDYDTTTDSDVRAKPGASSHALGALNLGAGKDASDWIVGFAHHGEQTPGAYATACNTFVNGASGGYGWIPELTGHNHSLYHYDYYKAGNYPGCSMRVQAAHDMGRYANLGARGYFSYSIFIVDRDHGYTFEVEMLLFEGLSTAARDEVRIYRYPIVTRGVDYKECAWDCFVARLDGQTVGFNAYTQVQSNSTATGKVWAAGSAESVEASDVVGGYVPPYVPPDDPDEPEQPVPPPGPGEGGIVMYRADGTPVAVSALWTRQGEMLRVVYRTDGSPLVLWSEVPEQDDNPTSGFWLIDGDGYRLIDSDGYALTVSA